MTEQKNLIEDGDKILVQKDNRQVGHLWGWTHACGGHVPQKLWLKGNVGAN